jgi:hypothetical protein
VKNHIAPDGGYVFGNKNQYRRQKWAFVERVLHVPIKQRKVLLLETEEFNEVTLLLKRGYRAENLVLVNRGWDNAALKAWATRRLRETCGVVCPLKGVAFVEAVRSVSGVHVFDFDSTGTTDSALETLRATVAAAPYRHVTVVTALGGRDSQSGLMGRLFALQKQVLTRFHRGGELKARYQLRDVDGNKIVDNITLGDIQRYTLLAMNMSQTSDDDESPCSAHIECCRQGKYLSTSGQSMVWFAGAVEPHTDRELVKAAEGWGDRRIDLDLAAFLKVATGASSFRMPWCILRRGAAWAAEHPDMAAQIVAELRRADTAGRLQLLPFDVASPMV